MLKNKFLDILVSLVWFLSIFSIVLYISIYLFPYFSLVAIPKIIYAFCILGISYFIILKGESGVKRFLFKKYMVETVETSK